MLDLSSKKITPYTQKVNGTIASAIKLYESNGVPLRQLMTDFNSVLSHPDELKKAYNPWECLNNNINKVPVVCGVSVAESLFNVAAMSLVKQPPIRVIKSIYYRNKSRNDSGLERIFIESVSTFLNTSQKILIVNPSPIMVEYFEESNKNVAYAVVDGVLVELYRKQYPESEFVTLEDVNKVSDIKVLLLIASNMKDTDLPIAMKCMEITSAECAFGIFQTRLIDNKQSSFWRERVKGNWEIEEIVLLSRELSSSQPKNKCFISLNKGSQNDAIVMKKLVYDEQSKSVMEEGDILTVAAEELYASNTAKSLWKKKQSCNKEELCGKGYIAAQQYRFSKEIYLSYSIYTYANGFYAKAYYAATDNTSIPTLRGKALTARTTKGLRGKSIEDVIDAFEEFAYDTKVANEIISDIKTHYLSVGKQVSLKTLWFCLRDSLAKRRNYNEKIAQIIFSKENKSISNICPSEVDGEKIREALSDFLEEGEEVKELQYLKLINVIIEEAINKGYLFENRLLPLIPRTENRASKRQSEVRHALTKKNFEKAEEKQIMNYLLPICVKSSLSLAVMIRLLTGISVKEVSGLQWKDFTYDADVDIYKLSVNKIIDNDGKMIAHALKDRWDKHRVIPLSSLLSKILVMRKNYLFEKGLTEEIISGYPIVLARENISHIQKGYKEEYCRPAVIAQKCREAVSKAEIVQHLIILPENGSEMEVDINSYMELLAFMEVFRVSSASLLEELVKNN